ncbi:MAG: Helicase associated domain protein, partial [Propionicimonas sp.]
MPNPTTPTPPASATPAPAHTQPDAFTQLLAELDWWIDQHGSAYVPQNATSRDVDGRPYPLGQRLHDRRKRHRAGRLHPDHARALEARTGWAWSSADRVVDDARERHLTTLRTYAKQHGSLDGLDVDHVATAVWLRNQRNRGLNPELQRELATIPGATQPRRERISTFTAALADWVAGDPERDASALRWSSTGALVDGIERAGVRAEVLTAESAGLLDEVEDELFRFARVVEG